MTGPTQSTSSRFSRSDVFSLLAIAAAVFIGWHGVMAVPIQIGATIEGLGLSEQSSGTLGTAEITTVALVAMLLATGIDRWSKPKVAMIGLALVIPAQLLSTLAPGFAVLLPLRLLVGFGAGLIYGAACASIAGHPQGDRLYAWGMSLGQVALATMLFFLPSIADHYDQQRGVFATLAILSLLAGAFLLRLRNPSRSAPQVIAAVETDTKRVAWATIILFFVALTLFNIAIGMVWGFVERRAEELEMAATQVGLLLAALPFGGVLGSLIAGLIGGRFGRMLPFVVALTFCTLACFTFAYSENHMVLLGAMLALGVFELFVVAFFIGTASVMDDVGRIATTAGGATLLTYGFGPGIGGFLSPYFTVSEICVIAGIFCLAAAAVSLPLGLALNKSERRVAA